MDIIENEYTDEKYECPFCNEEIRIWLGGSCGSNTEGSISISHTCDTGLHIGWCEDGQENIEEAKKCLVKFEKPL